MIENKSFLITIFVTLTIVAVGYGIIRYNFYTNVTTVGNSNGFIIGEEKKSALIKAKKMLEAGNIEALHIYPNYENDDYWKLIVDSTWWNNKISLNFENGRLVEIRRDRICCELP